MKLIGKGAEANLYLDDGMLIKRRIKKEYRIREMDEKIRTGRTRREGKLLVNSRRAGVNVPRVFKVEERGKDIRMEFLRGEMGKKFFDEEWRGNMGKIAEEIGQGIAILHSANIVHNDLTTSNIILKDKKVYFIDFGLGFTSTRIEDKAMDLVVLKKALRASHIDNYDRIWDGVLHGYRSNPKHGEILNRVAEIEKRVRYL